MPAAGSGRVPTHEDVKNAGRFTVPREMFGDVVDPSVKVGTKQWYTVPLSILTHAVGAGAR